MRKSAARHIAPPEPRDAEKPRPPENPPLRGTRQRRFRSRRLWQWALGIALVCALLAVAAALFIDEPLRQYTERQMNVSLQGYTVKIRKLDFHPLGFSIDLEDWTITQNGHPKPPVADFPRMTASVQWRSIIRGRLLADFHFAEPKIHVNRQHLAAEAKDDVPVSEHGWQDALQAAYPLKINEFTIADGEITYIDDDPKRPLTIKDIDFRAENIRNIRSRERTYPSEIHMTGVVFDSGKLRMDGNADFMAEPHVGIKAAVDLDDMELDYFAPVVEEYNIKITKGTLSAAGNLEYSPTVKVGELRQVTLETVALDYANRPTRDAAVKQAAAKTKEAAKEVANDPDILLKIDRLQIQNSIFGFVNEADDPHYRLFLSETNATLQNLSNQRKRGAATAELKGKFMGSGDTVTKATFRPEVNGPDFDMKLEIRDTDLRALNDLLRAYGKFDVADGEFGLIMEVSVKDDRIDGYVKPFFRGMDVYDPEQDKDENVLQKAYEGIVGGVAGLLENAPRDEVATKIDISGPASNPRTSTWQMIINLLQNAFFKAILPQFDVERGGREKKEEEPATPRERSVPPDR